MELAHKYNPVAAEGLILRQRNCSKRTNHSTIAGSPDRIFNCTWGFKMRVVLRLSILTLLLFVPAWSFADSAHQNGGTNISFTVSMPQPHTHLFEVEMRITEHGATYINENVLSMPVWTPGSYMVREFSRHVQDFSPVDASGRPLPWEKINKNSWRIKTNNARDVRVRYRVYANELTVRTSELNSDHAFWNNTSLLM